MMDANLSILDSNTSKAFVSGVPSRNYQGLNKNSNHSINHCGNGARSTSQIISRPQRALKYNIQL